MSTIVVVRKGSEVTIASDSLFHEGSTQVSPDNKVNHQKVHRFGDAYIGFTGWAVFHDVFDSVLEKYPGSIDLRSRKHIFQTFLELHGILKEHYHLEVNENTEQPFESSRWNPLIACPAGIFAVGTFREVIEYRKYWADGSGSNFALGAAQATYDILDSSAAIAKAAVEAACVLDDGTGLPLQTYTVKLRPGG